MAKRLVVLESRIATYQEIPPLPEAFAEGGLPPLVDRAGRRYRYLRLSVTDRCDLACEYCMPPSGEEEHAVRRELLSFEEAVRLVSVLAQMGIERVRFTGGEPLIRRDIVRLVDMISRRTPVSRLAMTTNATRLAELAHSLRLAGLNGVNISLDSLDADRFAAITRGGDLRRVLAGLHAALAEGLEVKLNVVPMRGVNDDELEAIVRWAWSIGVTPRFIELMPLGEGAKVAHRRMTIPQVQHLLAPLLGEVEPERDTGLGPATYRKAREGSARVGFISPMSDTFCSTCNRIRVTARGDLRACLADRRAISLRDVMREGASDRELAWALHHALGGKNPGHFFNDAAVDEHLRVGMSLIGG